MTSNDELLITLFKRQLLRGILVSLQECPEKTEEKLEGAIIEIDRYITANFSQEQIKQAEPRP